MAIMSLPTGQAPRGPHRIPMLGRNESALENFGVIKNKKGGKIIGNRTRQFAYNFRASEQEKNLIDKAIVRSGLTMTAFVIRAITEKPITVIENGTEILAELKRQGNNLNQVVRGIYNGLVTKEELRNCIAELKKLYAKISIAIGGG